MNRICYILFFLFPILSFAQVKNVGSPSIRNYPKSEYNGGTQNWGISQDQHGFMYFANNDGILRFDGFNWQMLDTDIPLPVRSVYVDDDNRIFVGLIDNFGEIKSDNSGKYKFHSLRNLFDASVSFTDVWNIREIDGGIVFQSFEKLFVYDRKNIKVYSPKKKYHFSFEVNGRLLLQEQGLGLYEYQSGSFKKLAWAEPVVNDEIINILNIGEDKLLIGTSEKLYKYENNTLTECDCPANDFVMTNKLFSATSILGNYIVLGSILNGAIISDFEGNVVHVLNRAKGLQNNTVLSLFADRDKNLWVGLDNGISFVQINSPISYVSQNGDIGTGYCCVIENGNFYLGTNQGLYVKSYNDFSKNTGTFKLIENTEGQVWSLKVFDGKVICGHNFGTFLIDNNIATKLNAEPGGWTYIRPKRNQNFLIGGFYSGMALFKFENNTWRFYKKLDGFNESCRFIVEDKNGNLWISHGSKGVFRITLSDDFEQISVVKFYNQAQGLPDSEKNIVLLYNHEPYVSTVDGIYEYDQNSDRFVKSVQISELLAGVGRVKNLSTDGEGNLWFLGEEKSGVLRLNEDLTYTRITAPFESIKGKLVREFEFVYPYDQEQIFFGIDIGFAHYSSKFPKSYENDFSAYITEVELSYLDTTIYPMGSANSLMKFPFRKNSFRFHYTTPLYENIEEIRFSYLLQDYSEDWSAWSTDVYNDYTNLPFGDYIFKVKAINRYGVESRIHEFAFSVLPPWYRTHLAHAIYIIFALALIFSLVVLIRYRIRHSEEKARLQHQKEMHDKEEHFKHQKVIAEKEIIKLRNDKLRSEMVHRDKELANQTNNIIQKNRLLMKINQELQKIQSTTEDGVVKSKMAILKRRIEKEIDDKQQNRIFETYFDEAHQEFFNRLKDKFPQLSPNDLRLCAYIRMNISTKEIATLLNISFRGVEISRYRLRKKLELSREVNLSTFLSGI